MPTWAAILGSMWAAQSVPGGTVVITGSGGSGGDTDDWGVKDTASHSVAILARHAQALRGLPGRRRYTLRQHHTRHRGSGGVVAQQRHSFGSQEYGVDIAGIAIAASLAGSWPSRAPAVHLVPTPTMAFTSAAAGPLLVSGADDGSRPSPALGPARARLGGVEIKTSTTVPRYRSR